MPLFPPAVVSQRIGSHPRPPFFRRACIATLVAGWIGLSASARAGWDNATLTDYKFQNQQHLSINTWTADGLSATNETGNLVTIPTRDILTVSSGEETARQMVPGGWKLLLRNGDVIYGVPAGTSGDNLIFDAPDVDDGLSVPISRIVVLVAPASDNSGANLRLPKAGDRDLLVFKAGADRLEGIFDSVNAQSIRFAAGSSDTPSSIDLARVQALVFGGAKPARKIPPLSVRLHFASSVLTVPVSGAKESFSWTLAQATIKDVAGKAHTFPVGRITRVDVLGGRVVFLTELDPDSEEQVNFLNSTWPYQIDKNALGQPLSVGRTTFDHGIGVHTQSTLVYTLDGSFDTLSIRVGLDDSAAPLGLAKASIVLDGKTLWHDDLLKPGELSPPLSLPIKDGKRLELHADSAGRLDVQGRVDWITPALVRN